MALVLDDIACIAVAETAEAAVEAAVEVLEVSEEVIESSEGFLSNSESALTKEYNPENFISNNDSGGLNSKITETTTHSHSDLNNIKVQEPNNIFENEFSADKFNNDIGNISNESASDLSNKENVLIERTSTFDEQTIDNFELEEKRSELNLELGNDHDSKTLRRNLDEAIGKKSNPENSRAHHIVGEKTPESAKKLEQFGIDRNDPANGILLPNDAESPLKGSLHTGGHTQKYYNIVEQRMAEANTYEESLEVLQSLKEDLYSGEVSLQNHVMPNK